MERKVRDSCGKAWPRETPQARSVEEAPGPPAESECLEWKSTFEFYKQKKHKKHGVLSIKTKLIGTEGTRLLREKRGQGRPHRREASRADRPRKASAWSGNPYTSPPPEIRSLSADCLPSIDN
ncbi:hypothetical protein BKC07_12445 [Peribacillus simplex]|nr:hypothetical protein BKC07_12445 [Peribacillus simplex]